MRPVGLVGAQGGGRGGLFASAWAAASAAAPAVLSAGRRVGAAVSWTSGGRLSAGPASARFGAFPSMAARFAGCVADSNRENCTTRDNRDYRA